MIGQQVDGRSGDHHPEDTAFGRGKEGMRSPGGDDSEVIVRLVYIRWMRT